MKITLLVLVGVVVVTLVAYLLLFSRSFSKPGGGTATIQAPPVHYASNGSAHIAPYVSRLLVPANHFKLLAINTPDETRGFALDAKDGVVHASFDVECRQELQKEAAIRAFFSLLGVAPSRDYLVGKGGAPDATRVLEYPVNGNGAEVTALTKRILQELCGVSPTEALDISYGEE